MSDQIILPNVPSVRIRPTLGSFGNKSMDGKKSACFKEEHVKLFLQCVTLLVVILGLILIIVSVARPVKADKEIRRIIVARPENVVGGSGEAGASLTGKWIEDFSSFSLTYDFRYPTTMSTIQSVVVRGPIHVGASTADVLVALCGSPSSVVCDVTTEPGRLKGVIQTFDSNGSPALPILREIRSNPDLYYLEVWTTAVPTEPGALRSPMYFTMGPDL